MFFRLSYIPKDIPVEYSRDLFLNNQPDALIIQIISASKQSQDGTSWVYLEAAKTCMKLTSA